MLGDMLGNGLGWLVGHSLPFTTAQEKELEMRDGKGEDTNKKIFQIISRTIGLRIIFLLARITLAQW